MMELITAEAARQKSGITQYISKINKEIEIAIALGETSCDPFKTLGTVTDTAVAAIRVLLEQNGYEIIESDGVTRVPVVGPFVDGRYFRISW